MPPPANRKTGAMRPLADAADRIDYPFGFPAPLGDYPFGESDLLG